MSRRALLDLHRSAWPRVGQRLTLTRYALTLHGSVRSLYRHCLEFRVDSLAAALVVKRGWQLASSYQLAHGIIDARFRIVSVQGDVLRLQGIGTPAVLQRRRHPRAVAHVLVRVIRTRSEWAHPIELAAHTLNISLGGARVSFHEPGDSLPREHERAQVEIALPHGRISAVACFIDVWLEGARLRFDQISETHLAQLADFIDGQL